MSDHVKYYKEYVYADKVLPNDKESFDGTYLWKIDNNMFYLYMNTWIGVGFVKNEDNRCRLNLFLNNVKKNKKNPGRFELPNRFTGLLNDENLWYYHFEEITETEAFIELL